MSEGFSSLVQPVRWSVLGKYLGQLALVLAVLAVPPLAVAVIAGEWLPVPRYLVAIGVLLAAGWPLSRLRAPDRLQGNEAMVIVTLAFVLGPLLLAWPMAAAGLSYLDALFESVSGFTTTGLTTLQQVADLPRFFLFARAWMQWFGGLGIAVLAVALLARQGLASRKLVETSGAEILVSTSRAHARRVLAVYALISAAAFAQIWAAGLDPFTALIHTLAAVSTGGFSGFDRSLGGALPPLVPYALMLASLVGAISLPTLYAALRSGPGVLWADYELRALLLLCALWSAVLALWFGLHGMGLAQALHHGGLLAVSAQTTTGFSTLDPAGLAAFPKGVLILAMIVGGSVGSTAGGIKLLRWLILLRLLQLLVRRASVPEHGVVEARLGGRQIDDAELVRAILIVALMWVLVLLSWLVFLAYGYPPLDALFEVVSATATVGLSTGVTAPDLPAALKALLCVDMLAGRLEVVALLVTVYPPTWFGRR
jgi:trk system potassium uptake protein TrkH